MKRHVLNAIEVEVVELVGVCPTLYCGLVIHRGHKSDVGALRY